MHEFKLLTLKPAAEKIGRIEGEKIEAAAILYDGIIYFVDRPGRHHNVAHLMYESGMDTITQCEQGFLTSAGRYANRRAACVIAERAGQILQKTPPKDYLFSEDVW